MAATGPVSESGAPERRRVVPLSGDELLRLSVTAHGIRLGRPVDLILGPANGRRAVGLDVLCGDEEHRFLPLAAATLDPHGIRLSSSLALLDETELAYYRERGSTLRGLRGRPVVRRGRPVGALKDLVLDADGSIDALLVETRNGPVEVSYGADVELPSGRPSGS